ncbi:MAG: hypothetical protein BAA01_07960 [Bacillus thermozeamaize]|uniref:Uncharacterized protein n=1 Tax=Bacillus thermozeamaize TaxID=230954 RepID=A0A1Y3PLR5_9BACI|nr:MAG: hypothetical protein BAA01_07960 [Bacillus thermozeamaize]
MIYSVFGKIFIWVDTEHAHRTSEKERISQRTAASVDLPVDLPYDQSKKNRSGGEEWKAR